MKMLVRSLAVSSVCASLLMPAGAAFAGPFDDQITATNRQLSRTPDSFAEKQRALDNTESAAEEIHFTRSNFVGVPTIEYTPINPGETEVPVAAMIPEVYNDISGMMRGTGIGLGNLTTLPGAASVYWTGLYLTESAIAGGFQGALTQAMGMQNAMRMANMETMMQANLFEESKPFVKAFVWCVQRKMRLNPVLSQTEASAQCRGDAGSLTSKLFNNTPSISWNFADDQAHGTKAKNVAMLAASNPLPTQITLTDMLFNNEGKMIGLAYDPRLALTKNDFKALFGDIRFSYDLLGGTGVAARVGKIEPIPPTKDRGALFTEEIGYVMDQLGLLLTGFCTAANAAGPLFNSAVFWQVVTNSQYAAISLPGMQFTPATGDVFVEMMRRDSNFALGTGTMNCLGPTVGSWNVVLSTMQSGLSVGIIPGINRPVVKLMYAYARQIALGRMLMKAAFAMDGIRRVSSGVLADSYVQKLALNLIEQAAATDDPEAVLERHSAKANAWLTKTSQRIERKNVEGAQNFAGQVADSQDDAQVNAPGPQ